MMPSSSSQNAEVKALMRQKLLEKQQKTEHPLLRQNTLGQSVCRLCETVIKTPQLWLAHQRTPKHLEYVEAARQFQAQQQSQPSAKSTMPPPPVPEPASKRQKLVAADDSDEEEELPAHRASNLPTAPSSVGQQQAQVSDAGAQSLEQVSRSLPVGFFDEEKAQLSDLDKLKLELGMEVVPVTAKTEAVRVPAEQEQQAVVEEKEGGEANDAVAEMERALDIAEKQQLVKRIEEIEQAREQLKSKLAAAKPRAEEKSEEEGSGEDEDDFDWRAKRTKAPAAAAAAARNSKLRDKLLGI